MRNATAGRIPHHDVCELGSRCWLAWHSETRDPRGITAFVEGWMADEVEGKHEGYAEWKRPPFEVEFNAVLAFVGGASRTFPRLIEPPTSSEGDGQYRQNDTGDAFIDRKGKVWFAATPQLQALLPAEPETVKEIPSHFQHPDVAARISFDQHRDRKHELEDRRIDNTEMVLIP